MGILSTTFHAVLPFGGPQGPVRFRILDIQIQKILSQPQLNLNLVGFDVKMGLPTTHHPPPPPPTQTQLPSQGASDQPLMLPKQQHQH